MSAPDDIDGLICIRVSVQAAIDSLGLRGVTFARVWHAGRFTVTVYGLLSESRHSGETPAAVMHKVMETLRGEAIGQGIDIGKWLAGRRETRRRAEELDAMVAGAEADPFAGFTQDMRTGAA